MKRLKLSLTTHCHNVVFDNCIFTRTYSLKDSLGIENIFSYSVFLKEESQQFIIYQVLKPINQTDFSKYYNIYSKSSKKQGFEKHN